MVRLGNYIDKKTLNKTCKLLGVFKKTRSAAKNNYLMNIIANTLVSFPIIE